MDQRKTHIIYGLKVFVIFWGLAALAGYLNRNPDASTSDLAEGAAIAAVIAVFVALFATYALKHGDDDAEA